MKTKNNIEETIKKVLEESLSKGDSPITEATLSKATLEKREEILKNLKKNKKELVKRYGKDAEAVMYGRATNLAKKAVSEMDKQKLKELVKASLMKDEVEENKVFGPGERPFKDYITAEQRIVADAFDIDPTRTEFDYKNNAVIFPDPIRIELVKGGEAMLGSVKMGNRLGFVKGYFDEDGNEIEGYMIKMPYKNKMKEAKAEFSKEFDNDPTLKGKQKELPDALQKAIIKKEKGVKEDIDLGHNEISSITPEGRFWIVTYRTIDGKKEKVFQSEDEARKFASTLNEDIDLGHEDNEPHMIKGELYQIGKYAMDLYAILEELEEKGGEYDFPAWWQSKITTAKNMMSGAKHYLDFELKEPAIDAMVDTLTDEEPHMGEPEAPMMEGEGEILDQVRNKLLSLFQPYGDFQILDMTMKGQTTGENFRLRAKSKGADWKGLENFMKNNPDFTIKHVSKQTFDNPKTIDFSYKAPMMEGEVTKTDKLAAKIAKALKDPKNKSAEDQNNIKQARKAMNKGDEKAAEKIVDPYLEEGLPKGFFKKEFGIGKKQSVKEDWDSCIAKITDQGKSQKAAEKICGAINAAYVGNYR